MNVEIVETYSRTVQSDIKSLLDEFNREKVGEDNHEPLILSVSDSGKLIAGLVGGTYWGYLYVDSLFVVKEHRDLGLGRTLLLRAEEIAFARGCYHSNIDSHEFQGYQFYIKLGYEVVGKLPDLPPGNFKYLLYKQLGKA